LLCQDCFGAVGPDRGNHVREDGRAAGKRRPFPGFRSKGAEPLRPTNEIAPVPSGEPFALGHHEDTSADAVLLGKHGRDLDGHVGVGQRFDAFRRNVFVDFREVFVIDILARVEKQLSDVR